MTEQKRVNKKRWQQIIQPDKLWLDFARVIILITWKRAEGSVFTNNYVRKGCVQYNMSDFPEAVELV